MHRQKSCHKVHRMPKRARCTECRKGQKMRRKHTRTVNTGRRSYTCTTLVSPEKTPRQRPGSIPHLGGVAAYAVTDSDVIVLEVVAVGRDLSEVPRRRQRPNVPAAVPFQDVRVRAGDLTFLHHIGTCFERTGRQVSASAFAVDHSLPGTGILTCVGERPWCAAACVSQTFCKHLTEI